MVTLEGASSAGAFSERLKSHQYTISRASWIGDYPDPTTFLDKFRAANGNNDALYNNPKFDALMDAAEGEISVLRRMGARATPRR